MSAIYSASVLQHNHGCSIFYKFPSKHNHASANASINQSMFRYRDSLFLSWISELIWVLVYPPEFWHWCSEEFLTPNKPAIVGSRPSSSQTSFSGLPDIVCGISSVQRSVQAYCTSNYTSWPRDLCTDLSTTSLRPKPCAWKIDMVGTKPRSTLVLIRLSNTS